MRIEPVFLFHLDGTLVDSVYQHVERLNAPIETAVVVGDSIWDMLAALRCRALGVGLLSGGVETIRCVPRLR